MLSWSELRGLLDGVEHVHFGAEEILGGWGGGGARWLMTEGAGEDDAAELGVGEAEIAVVEIMVGCQDAVRVVG